MNRRIFYFGLLIRSTNTPKETEIFFYEHSISKYCYLRLKWKTKMSLIYSPENNTTIHNILSYKLS